MFLGQFVYQQIRQRNDIVCNLHLHMVLLKQHCRNQENINPATCNLRRTFALINRKQLTDREIDTSTESTSNSMKR